MFFVSTEKRLLHVIDVSRYFQWVFLYVFCVQVTENSHRYLKEIEMREEAGTPAIVGAIRAGLVFQLKQVHLYM